MLSVAECNSRVDSTRRSSWYPRPDAYGKKDHQRTNDSGRWIDRTHAVKSCGHRPTEQGACADPHHQRDGSTGQRLTDDAAFNVPRLGTDRQLDGQFSRALARGVRDRSGGADQSQRQREQADHAEHERACAIVTRGAANRRRYWLRPRCDASPDPVQCGLNTRLRRRDTRSEPDKDGADGSRWRQEAEHGRCRRSIEPFDACVGSVPSSGGKSVCLVREFAYVYMTVAKIS